MRPHEEYEKDNLSESKKSTANGSEEYLAAVSHVMHMWVC